MCLPSVVELFRPEHAPPVDALRILACEVDVLPIDHPLAEMTQPIPQLAAVRLSDEGVDRIAEHFPDLGGVRCDLVSSRAYDLRRGPPGPVGVDHLKPGDELAEATGSLVGLFLYGHPGLARSTKQHQTTTLRIGADQLKLPTASA